MSNLRTLLSSTAAILACACAGALLDSAAAQSTRSTTPTPRIAARSVAKRQRHPRSACHASHHRRTARSTCVSHAAHPDRSRAAGSRLHASLARVLGTPCANTELTPEPGNLEQTSAATLCLVNQERARNGELPLQVSGQLEQAAWGHSEEMVSEDYFAHIAPSGLTPVGRVEATGYVPNQQVGYTLGENIAWGTLQLSTPSAIVAAWIASPEHLANILFSSYRDTAIGVAPAAPASLADGEPGAVYTQEFGVIVG